MPEPKFGKWTHVNDRLPGRDEKVLAADPVTGEQFMVTGGELALRTELFLWMPLMSRNVVSAYLDGAKSET